MISLSHIDKYYRHGFGQTFVLRNVGLNIEEGDFVTIQGPSGSGKSTLLHILGLIDDASRGEYDFMGEPVHLMSQQRRTELHRRHIGFIFQAYHLIDDLTVYENLETPLLYQGRPGKERKARVADMLDRFGIVAKKKLFPSQLSGGQQQLVAVARALIIEPQLILADEPTGNLHSDQGQEVMDSLQRVHREYGVTIVQVTHSKKQAEYGNRVLQLVDGRIISDTPGNMAAEPSRKDCGKLQQSAHD